MAAEASAGGWPGRLRRRMNKTGFTLLHREMRARRSAPSARLSQIENQVHSLPNDNRQLAKNEPLDSVKLSRIALALCPDYNGPLRDLCYEMVQWATEEFPTISVHAMDFWSALGGTSARDAWFAFFPIKGPNQGFGRVSGGPAQQFKRGWCGDCSPSSDAPFSPVQDD